MPNIESNPTLTLKETLENVLPFYVKKSRQGQRVCLVTQVKSDGASPRPVGSQIAVSEDGENFGFITGGCAEAAIVHEALMAMRENSSRTIRIGSDSPWFDIKLPCGAGIDINFLVADATRPIVEACSLLQKRVPVSLEINLGSEEVRILPEQSQRQQHTFVRRYLPGGRLAVFGTGPYVGYLKAIASASDYDVMVWTPDSRSDKDLHSTEINSDVNLLSRSESIDVAWLDRWTAAVLLFHEHDWEPKLLREILKKDCFYVGALGGRKTHADRVERLEHMGVAQNDIQRIHGPVGIDIGSRSPQGIAVSILAQIVEQQCRLNERS